MNKEQSIEEMARDLEQTYAEVDYCEAWHCGGCKYEQYGKGYICHSIQQAEKMFVKGYRKQSVGEWVVTDADSGSFGEYAPFIEFKCPKCGVVYGIESGQYGWEYGEPIPWVACPLCGAKMKGGE